MELCLKWGVFSPTHKITLSVVHDADDSLNNASVINAVKAISEDTDPLMAEIPPTGFSLSYPIEFLLFVISLRLLCVYMYQRKQMNVSMNGSGNL